MTAETGKGEAEYIRLVESARAQAQAEMIRTISEGFERAGAAKETTPEMIALRFIEALEKMIQSPAVQQVLPPGQAETVEAMRRSAEVHHRQ
jgi:regulator of protease activity HflC (stomatin/prohibitin superfamily)